ncbi:MAG: hypothetical protein LBC31_12710 [Treponema sp.]|jgi:hypothetical protein|nr:hypothetical protein [Treponema sp.]
MANEFQFLPNPDNIPGKVSSGYQRQNTNMYALQTGIDTTEPCDNGAGVISIPAGGVVDLNGVMFRLTRDIILNKPSINTAYWVAVADNGDGTATASLVTRPGAWSADKLGCYRTDGARTLNYVSLGDLDNPSSEAPEYSSPQQKGIYRIQLPFGWKYAELASGKGNGPGGSYGGYGGTPVIADAVHKIWLHASKGWLEIKIGANGGTGGNGRARPGGGGGGGGGSGSGEYSEIRGIIKTRTVKPGAGGNANYQYGGGGGSPGGSSGYAAASDGGMAGGAGSVSISGSYTYYEGGGGKYGGGDGHYGGDNSVCGGGGGQGLNGCEQPDGTAGGYCDIYRLFN